MSRPLFYQRAGVGRHPRQHRAWSSPVSFRNEATKHYQRREGDEMACSCGARWAVGEDHP